MLDKITPLFNKYYIYISYLVIFFLNFQTLDNIGFIDDFTYLSQGSHIATAPNPFEYFFPWSEYFKSWALTYFFMWFLYALFADNFVFYRLINLTLHFVNHLILRKILRVNNRDISQTKLNILSLIFLLHPLSVLTTTWAFQFKTVLSVMFTLLFVYFIIAKKINTKTNYAKLLFLFWMSLTSKIVAILAPLAVFLYWKPKFQTKRSLLLVTPLLLLSLFYGLFNLKGVTTAITERLYLKKTVAQETIPNQEINAEVKSIRDKIALKHGSNSRVQGRDLVLEINDSVEAYANSLLEKQNFFIKYFIGLQNLGRLFTHTIGLNNYFPFYETNLQTATAKITYLYAIVGFFFFTFIFLTKNFYLNMTLALFIPVSGFLYVPYMKHSYTSDHWLHAPSLFLLVYFFSKFKHNNKLIALFFFFISSNYLYTIYKFENFQTLLEKNHQAYENDYILKNIIAYDIKFNRGQASIEPLETIIKNNGGVDNYNQEIFRSMLMQNARKDYIRQYYSYFMTKSLNDKNAYLTFMQNRTFKSYVDDRVLSLTPVLNTINSETISEDLYQITLKALE